MSNTINMNGMTSYYNSFIKSITAQTSVEKGAKTGKGAVAGEKDFFISTLNSKVVESGVLEETAAVSTKDMTLEEYKDYIHETISSFSLCPDKMGDYYSINISDDGFRVMQNDPEYEKWVLDDLKTAFATPMPEWARSIGGTKYQVVHYGATKEECHSTSWWTGYQNGTGGKVWEAQSKGSFWTKRGEQKKIQNRIDKKTTEKRELEEKWLQEAAEKRQEYTDFLNGKAMLKTNNISEVDGFFKLQANPNVAGIISAYETGTFKGNGVVG